jgi:hypothetical protein
MAGTPGQRCLKRWGWLSEPAWISGTRDRHPTRITPLPRPLRRSGPTSAAFDGGGGVAVIAVVLQQPTTVLLSIAHGWRDDLRVVHGPRRGGPSKQEQSSRLVMHRRGQAFACWRSPLRSGRLKTGVTGIWVMVPPALNPPADRLASAWRRTRRRPPCPTARARCDPRPAAYRRCSTPPRDRRPRRTRGRL